MVDSDTRRRRAGPAGSMRSAGLPLHHMDSVQALRALAVSLVVVYHAAPGIAPGGYVGVDVFFVISGFLITGILLRSTMDASGRLDLVQFYVRRVRRILPAATAVIIVTCIVGLWILPTTQWNTLGADASAAAQFRENWNLAAAAVDYLAEGQSPSPFQHYWSLSIEEQYYALWPPLLALALAVSRKRNCFKPRGIAAVLLAGIAAVSFTLALSSNGSAASYFQTQTRAWELAMGGLLACASPLFRRWLSRCPALLRTLPWLGLASIIAGSFSLSETTVFPGLSTLVPVAGAMLVIAGEFGRQPRFLERAYRFGVVVWLGKVSYSLYLVHWPVLIFIAAASRAGVTELSLVDAALGVVASLLLAAFWRRWIEVPFLEGRIARSWLRLPRACMVAAVGLVVMGTTAGLAVQTVYARVQEEQRVLAAELEQNPPAGFGAASIGPTSYAQFVSTPGVMVPAPENARVELPEGAEGRCKSDMASPTTPVCDFGSNESSTVIALVGDSHMEQYLPAFQQLAATNGWHIVTYFHSSCPFSYAQRISDQKRGGPCLEANEGTLDSLSALDPDLIVTSNRTAVPFVGDGTAPSPAEGFIEMWAELVSRDLGPVVVIADNPLMLPDDGTIACVSENRREPDRCSRDRTAALPVDHQLAAAAGSSDVTLLDLTARYCTPTVCPPVIGSVLVYRDEQHITPVYARTLAQYIAPTLLHLLRS